MLTLFRNELYLCQSLSTSNFIRDIFYTWPPKLIILAYVQTASTTCNFHLFSAQLLGQPVV